MVEIQIADKSIVFYNWQITDIVPALTMHEQRRIYYNGHDVFFKEGIIICKDTATKDAVALELDGFGKTGYMPTEIPPTTRQINQAALMDGYISDVAEGMAYLDNNARPSAIFGKFIKVNDEIPPEVPDNIITTFTTAYKIIPGTESIMWDGNPQDTPGAYSIGDDWQSIIFTDPIPVSSELRFSYWRLP